MNDPRPSEQYRLHSESAPSEIWHSMMLEHVLRIRGYVGWGLICLLIMTILAIIGACSAVTVLMEIDQAVN